MTRIGKTLCLVASVALWQGCSSTSDNGDGSVDGDIQTDAPTVFLSRGSNYYKVTASTTGSDVCGIMPAAFVNEVLPVTFVEATQTLSVGNPQGVPLQPSLGTGGNVGLTGTLTRENDTADDAAAGCRGRAVTRRGRRRSAPDRPRCTCSLPSARGADHPIQNVAEFLAHERGISCPAPRAISC